MKLSHLAVLMAAAFLAGCGGGIPEGDVRFIGFAPVTAKDKDVRAVQIYTPAGPEQRFKAAPGGKAAVKP